MRQEILNKLAQIKAVSELTGMQGNVTVEFNIPPGQMDAWDKAVESITEYPRYRHNIEVCKGMNVQLLVS